MQYNALNTNDTRNRNLAAVFEAVRTRPGVSRSEIGQAMPFSLQTMTNVVQELIGLGMIEEVERQSSGRKGSPHRGLRVVNGKAHALGLQIRWNSCSLVLVNLDLEVVAQSTVQIAAFEPEAYLDELLGHIRAFLAQHPYPVWTAGVSAPLALEVPNVPQYQYLNLSDRAWRDSAWFSSFWQRYSAERLQRRMAEALPFPVAVINNPQSVAVAEAQKWPASARFIYVQLGLGLGAAFVHGRAVNRDFWRQAGEIGHVVMDGRAIGATLSVTALRKRLAVNAPQGEFEPILAKAFHEGDDRMDDWFRDAAKVLGFIVNFLENAIWPDGILIGGFLPREMLQHLVETTRPLSPSVVLPDDSADRFMPRFDVARRSSEAIPLGAAVSQLCSGSDSAFANLIGSHRR